MLPHIFIVSCFVTLSLAASANETVCAINIPGYTHHGNCNLLCRSASWKDIAIFFLGNYVAHAATVTTEPGQSIYVTISSVVLALLFPGAGVVKALKAIISGAVFAPTELQQAARAGALYMVKEPSETNEARDMPASGNEPSTEPGDENPSSLSLVHTQLSEATDTDLEMQVCEQRTEDATKPIPVLKPAREPVYLMAPRLHGICKLPAGYSLIRVPPTARFEEDVEDVEPQSWQQWISDKAKGFYKPPPKRTSIPSSYNLVKIAISIAQLLFACATLYRTKGDQIELFGYAAFGLTVAQYAWMSFMNLVGNLLCPQYSTRFFVESQSLDRLKEALDSRYEHQKSEFPIRGAVGRIIENPTVSNRKSTRQKLSGTSSLAFMTLCCGAVPVAIIGGLSRFSNGNSKRYQRAWVITWLVFGFFYGPTSYDKVSKWTLKSREGRFYKRYLFFFTLVLPIAAYATPAIGGFVVVGQMIKQYDICSEIK